MIGAPFAEATMGPNTRCATSYAFADDVQGTLGLGAGVALGLNIALSLCTTAHPLYTRFAKIIGASFYRGDNATGP